ncbi:YhgN family NAAT transporter [Suttonella sp. R2A3]|uniref:YhgN family NAAT transporter n=1 Tax=Suttonella sp. R2A3 TaxID=2908648 RepID=UPI001F172B45|nr:YhgN family NAAT transporter [Suttonella sp. R2A3]UJF23644.1 YhgN family NAAT transporter [Suttonella sp. R2A3]
MEVWATAVTLFLIMDPFGNLPIWMSVLSHVPRERRQRIVARESLIALIIMLFFLYSGPSILRVLNLSREALAIAGGLVLFIIAMRMIFPSRGGVMGDDDDDSEPLIVPLAMPLFAGPSLLAMLILLVEGDPQHMQRWLIAVLAAWAAASVILISGSYFYRFLGNRGLKAIERLMGMILLSISVQLLLNAISTYVQQII